VDPSALAARIEAAVPPRGMVTRVVAIDGHGGAGKTTLAARLAEALGAPVVHTDDFASWDEPVNWWPRLLEQVLRPLSEARPARYQRYDWDDERLAEWIDLPAADVVILEGVSASRREFAPYLAFTIWVDTLRELCLERGLARDGAHQRELWEGWMASEDEFFARDRPWERAGVTVAGVS
jgi:uridine kinase